SRTAAKYSSSGKTSSNSACLSGTKSPMKRQRRSSPARQRAAAEYLGQGYEVSQRRAGAALGRARSTPRYTPRERGADRPPIRAIRRLARKHLRWGYRRIHARLGKPGWAVNLKEVHRPWRELGLRRKVR